PLAMIAPLSAPSTSPTVGTTARTPATPNLPGTMLDAHSAPMAATTAPMPRPRRRALRGAGGAAAQAAQGHAAGGWRIGAAGADCRHGPGHQPEQDQGEDRDRDHRCRG